MTELKGYESREPEGDVFQDYSAGGIIDGNGAARITESVMAAWMRALKGKKKLGDMGIEWVDKREGSLKFKLEGGIWFALANEGARGLYLNATWNPTRVLTGQNVFRVRVGEVRFLGVELKLLPADIIEFPFRVFLKGMDEDLGKDWEGRKLLSGYLAQRQIYWRRMDLTTYSAQMPSRETLQSVLGVIDLMASSSRVIGFDARDHKKALELSLRSFAAAKFESYRSDVGDFETVAFTKCFAQNRDQSLYRLSIYNKSAEVRASGDEGNKLVVKKHRDELKNRLRIELQLYPTSFLRVRKFGKIAKLGDSKWTTSSALNGAFPTLEAFDRKKRELVVAAIEDLHLDYLLAPKNPYMMLEKAEALYDESYGLVLKAWRDAGNKPLPGKNQLKVKGLTRGQISSEYQRLRESGLDVTRISYVEACALWNTLVSSHLTLEENDKVQADADKRTRLKLSDKAWAKMWKESDEIWKNAQQRALTTRSVVRSYLTSKAVAKNLGVR